MGPKKCSFFYASFLMLEAVGAGGARSSPHRESNTNSSATDDVIASEGVLETRDSYLEVPT
jgi:hypothetical protein